MPVPPPVPAIPGTPAAQVGAVTRADPATGAVASADPETSVAPTGADSELPRDVLAVVARWNPQGAALLRAARGAGAGSAVALIGPDDANTTLLRTELARFEPRIDLTEPMGEVGSSVESTLPGATPAAVALVLLDAGSVVGADSLGLIRRLRAEDTRILLAMNGIHAYGDWRSVRDRDLELLAAQDLADLEIIPVSARLAAAARAGGDAALMDRSGLGALHTELTEASASASAPGDGRLAALDARVLAETRTRVQAQLETLRSGAEPTRWRAERATLIASRDSGRATAMSTLRGQLHLARVDLMTEVGGQVRALHVAARAELDRQRQADLAHYPDRLQQVVTELTGVIDVGIDRRLAELAAKVDADGVSTGDTPSGNVAPPHRRRDAAPRVGPDPEPRHRGVEDHLMIRSRRVRRCRSRQAARLAAGSGFRAGRRQHPGDVGAGSARCLVGGADSQAGRRSGACASVGRRRARERQGCAGTAGGDGSCRGRDRAGRPGGARERGPHHRHRSACRGIGDADPASSGRATRPASGLRT